jgi:hypothetical protein
MVSIVKIIIGFGIIWNEKKIKQGQREVGLRSISGKDVSAGEIFERIDRVKK